MLNDRNAYDEWAHAEESSERVIHKNWVPYSGICGDVRRDIGWPDIYEDVFAGTVDQWVKPANWI